MFFASNCFQCGNMEYYSIFIISAIIISQPLCINNNENWREVSELYSHSWMVRITSGMETATNIAHMEGFSSVEIINLENIYHFYNPIHKEDIPKDDITDRLSKYQEVSWVKPVSIMTGITSTQNKPPLRLKSFRTKSKTENQNPLIIEPTTKVSCAGPENTSVLVKKSQLQCNDPLYPKQWFMRSCAKLLKNIPSPNGIQLIPTWQKYGLYGKGVKVIVADDGVLSDHLDLQNTLNLNYSADLVNRRIDPTPIHEKDSHGTKCAGIIAMEKDNGICGVGIAPGVTLGGVKTTQNQQFNDLNQAEAFKFKAEEIHILLHAFSYDDGKMFPNMPDQVFDSIRHGITKGRGGKGILYIFPSGNGKKNNDVCGCDPYVNSMFTIAIAGANHDGTAVYYSERCASIMATMYSGDGTSYNIVTVETTGKDKCDETFNGTSASSPMAAGALALLLEANLNLTWREVQHVIAWTSEVAPLANNHGWYKNGAGFYVSLDFGFGLMNIFKMVELAKNFKSIPAMRSCVVERPLYDSEVKINRKEPKSIILLTTGCMWTPHEVNFVEHVEVHVKMTYSVRGDLQIFLTSPSDTTVELLGRREKDKSLAALNYIFDSVHTWGENPRGYWVVDIFDSNGPDESAGVIEHISLRINGTKEKPKLYEKGNRDYFPFVLKSN